MTAAAAARAHNTASATRLPISPDLAQARQFLKLIDPAAKRFTLQTFDDNRARKASNLARVLELNGFTREVSELHKAGAGIYLTVNETDGKGRKDENIIRIRDIWQEDDSGYEGVFPIEPTTVIETSDGHFHRHWTVADDWPTDEKGQADFAGVMRRMVADYGSDRNAADVSRVLRIPGFYNQKDPAKPQFIQTVGGCGKRYTRAQILAAFPPLPEEKPKYTNGANGHSTWQPKSEEGERIRDALTAIPADDREVWLRIGMALKSELGDSGFDPWREWSLRSNKFDDKDCRRVWGSIEPEGGVTIATLFRLARDHGWQDESRQGPHQPQRSGRGSGAAKKPHAQAKPSNIIWGIPRGDEEQLWLVDQLLPETGVGLGPANGARSRPSSAWT